MKGDTLHYTLRGKKGKVRIPDAPKWPYASVLNLAVEQANKIYVPLIIQSPSRPNTPLGPCGAGTEDSIWIFGLAANRATIVGKKVVSSCINHVELKTEELGTPYDSIAWDAGKGAYKIDWAATSNKPESTGYLTYKTGRFW
ncbi:hypothetical protein GCM10010971_21770 [Silvimonas amylolytica]|uniref:Uncharacterized protein n=2 Tax=Silvimonas amylolytica TaxID=449663 RepID=A0ABQ2PM58_9NEIS|nr:hypothetical protein GCM10010971_21770 [Silvimonas amylolytica]